MGHRYLIVVRAGGPLDVTKMTLDGAGEFQAATNPDASGGELQAPHPLPASVPHHEFNDSNGAIPPQELIVTMGPDSESFDYFELSCGIQDFDGSGEHEYFAFDGLMTFTATSENTVFSSSATLTTSPEPTVPQP